MILNKVISYIKKNGILYSFKSRYIQYRLEHGKGWQLCGFDVGSTEKNKGTVTDEIKISILVPVYNTPVDYLKQMLDSVLWQTYDNWELCIADASDRVHGEVSDICREYSGKEQRFIYKKIKNSGIADNTNICISLSSGDYIALLDHDDILHPEALVRVVKEVKEKKADMVYTDEAVFEEKLGKITSLQIKPEYSPENLRGCNYICHLCVFSKELLKQVGGYKKQFDGGQDYDMALRLTEKAQKIVHISKILYYWRKHQESVAGGIAVKSYASEAGRMAVSEHLNRMKLPGDVYITKESPVVYRVKYRMENEQEDPVLLIQDGVADLGENDIDVLKSFANRREIGMVTGTVTNPKGKILQGPNSITDTGEVIHMFRKHNIHSVSLMNMMLYAQNIEMVGCGFFLMRRELYRQYETEIQEEKYSTSVLQKVSLKISKQGYKNIYVPWVRAECRQVRQLDLGMKKLPVGYGENVDRYANPSYKLFRKWIGI